jgi:type I site-specific restriction endonuclease
LAVSAISKKGLSEADICAKFITPAIVDAGWDESCDELERDIAVVDLGRARLLEAVIDEALVGSSRVRHLDLVGVL